MFKRGKLYILRKTYITMKSEQEIRDEMTRLFKLFMDPTTKKPTRDEAYIKFHSMNWVIEDEEDIIEKRLREINAARNKTPESE